MKRKQIRIRCWVEVDGVRFFGPGPAELLSLIETEGSISQAARKMKMSYRKAWNIIETLNANARSILVRSTKGGHHGGAAAVTRQGKELLAGYYQLTEKLNRVLESNKKLIRHL